VKILHLTGEFPPLVLGGLGTYVDAVAHLQAASGDEVMVCVLEGEAKKYNTVPKPLKKSGLTVAWRQFQPEKFSLSHSEIRSAASIIQQFDLDFLVKFAPDIIHVHDWYGALWGAALQQTLGAVMVFTSHLPTRAGFVYSGHSLAIKHKTQFEALAMRVANTVTVPSQFLAATVIAEYNVQPSKVKVVANGIDERFFVNQSPKKPNGKPQPIELLAVARLTEQKGLSYLNRAVAELKAQNSLVHCSIVGDGPLRESLESEIKQLNLQEQVELLGFRDHDALRLLYQRADIFVSTSIYEPFGLVVLEAMAAGLPVVAFQTGGIPEIIATEKFGRLVPPCDLLKLNRTIAELIESAHLRKKLGEAGKKRAKTFLWPEIVAHLKTIYQEIKT
jgi:glycosyltransferase involved in cell wall biosynthesis